MWCSLLDKPITAKTAIDDNAILMTLFAMSSRGTRFINDYVKQSYQLLETRLKGLPSYADAAAWLSASLREAAQGMSTSSISTRGFTINRLATKPYGCSSPMIHKWRD